MDSRRKKMSPWDILAIVFTAAALICLALILLIYANPDSGLNPFPFPTLPPTIVVPSPTPTLLQLPPTWTPTPLSETTRFPTSTPPPTETPIILTPGG